MKRAVCFLAFAAAAQASAAEVPPLSGSASFANGQGHISFEAGLLDIGVNRIRFDDILNFDGVPVGQSGVDSIDGSVFGGSVTFTLPGEDQMTWLGRRLRVKGHFERQKGDSTQRSESEATPTSEFLGISASPDGRAIVRVVGTTTAGSLIARVFGVNSDEIETCSGTIGTTTYDASVTGVSVHANCQTFVPSTVTFFGVSEDGSTGYTIFSGTSGLVGAGPLLLSFSETRSIAVRRGEVAFEGDHDIAPNLIFSPSAGLTFGETTSAFQQYEEFVGDNFGRWLGGRTTSHDVGVRVGGRVTYRVGSGFDLFASGSGAVVRRKSEMRSSSFGGSALIFVEDINGANVQVVEPETRAAFLADLNLGATYLLDTRAIGPLRLALSGGVSYDSDVATYGNIGITPTTDITAGPVAPAHIAYTGETTLSLKAEITVELP